MKQLFLLSLMQVLLIAPVQASDPLHILEAWVPESPPGAQVMAGFMKMHNPGTQDINVVSASSPGFKTVEMHLSMDVEGVAKMIPQHQLTIAAGKTLVLKPGSYHLMLIKPKKRFGEGEQIKIQLTLNNGEHLTFDVPVKRAGSSTMRNMKCGNGKCGMGKCGSAR